MSPIGGASYALLDTATGEQIPISPPDCPEGASNASFGGPYLAVQCNVPNSAGGYATHVDLLTLSTGGWQTDVMDPSVCDGEPGSCNLDAVGSSWIRISIPSMMEHDPPAYLLQNIDTGAVVNDGVYGADSLDNESGVSHPCAPVPSGAREEDFVGAGTIPGEFGQLGPFILNTGVVNDSTGATGSISLQSCIGKRARFAIPESPWASDDMVVWTGAEYQSGPNHPVYGLALPNPRRFIIPRSKGETVAVSNNTIYEMTYPNGAIGSYDLWSASVPTRSLR